MKKLLLTAGLVAAFSAASFAQGTVKFSNTSLMRMSIGTVGGGTASMPLTQGAYYFGLFYGTGATAPANLTMLSTYGVNSTSSAGIIASSSDNASAISTVGIPGTTAGEADVWIRIAGWSSAGYTPDAAGYAAAAADFAAGKVDTYFGQSAIVKVPALGPSSGPGITIWQAATGVNTSLLNVFPLLTNVPEPSSLAMLGLGATAMLIFRRRR